MTIYNRKMPFFAKVKKREENASKQTYHIVLDIKGSGITYEPGDSIGILPENDPKLVTRILNCMGCEPKLNIKDPRSGEDTSLDLFLRKKANLSKISASLTEALQSGKIDVKSHDICLLLENSNLAHFSVEDLIPHLLPQLPRFYSIASSMDVVGEEVHLLVSTVSYFLNEKEKRLGVASTFLCGTSDTIPLFVQRAPHFKLPNESNIPIIMIGNGTGIAPYRSFMHQREQMEEKRNWLFFGEKNSLTDFHFKDYWNDLENKDILKLHTAFSRDHQEKVYVQHQMLQNAKELWTWIEDNAIIYICGDAKNMAKDVLATLEQIFILQGKMQPDEAKLFLKTLRREKRLRVDVY